RVFDAADTSASPPPHQPHHASQKQGATVVRTEASRRERLAAARAEDQARKQAETKARERHRLEAGRRGANAQSPGRGRAFALLQKELEAAEKAVKDARQAVRDLERKVEGL